MARFELTPLVGKRAQSHHLFDLQRLVAHRRRLSRAEIVPQASIVLLLRREAASWRLLAFARRLLFLESVTRALSVFDRRFLLRRTVQPLCVVKAAHYLPFFQVLFDEILPFVFLHGMRLCVCVCARVRR